VPRRAGRGVAPRNAAREEALKDIQRRIAGHGTLLRPGKHWHAP
jgi:hypothetical protein